MSRNAPRTARRGFTILEMAIVLSIVALLVAAGMGMGASALKAADRVITQERLDTIKAAIEAYAKTNGYLPCPTDRALTPTANPTTFGREIRPCAASAPGLARISASVDIGGVPVRTLGLPDNYAADAWGVKFLYAATVALETAYSSADPGITIKTGDRTGTNMIVTSTTNRATVPSVPGSITAGAGASYVVLSHGPDKRGGYPLKATSVGIACGSGSENDVENCNEDVTFWDTDYNDANVAAEYFDDYIVWGSNALERANISTAATTCTGSCEAWCAACGGTPSDLPVAPASLTSGTAVLCKKIITSVSPCQATCLWAGTITSDSKRVRCP